MSKIKGEESHCLSASNASLDLNHGKVEYLNWNIMFYLQRDYKELEKQDLEAKCYG